MRTTIIVLGLLVLVVVVVVAKHGRGKSLAKKLKSEVTNTHTIKGWSHTNNTYTGNCDLIFPKIEGEVSSEEVAEFPTKCGRITEYRHKRSFLDNILKKTEELDENKRIVGGDESSENLWPWLAAIGRKVRGNTCGAALITDQFVVTAAHCIDTDGTFPCVWNVRLGEHNLHVDEGNHIDLEAEMIWIHPEYNSKTIENDIAVIKLSESVSFDRSVTPICMPEEREPPSDICFVAGWGKTSFTGDFSDTVRHLAINIYSDALCQGIYGDEFIPGEMFCANGDINGGKDICHGDSGSPLVCYNEESDRWSLMGIVSWDHGCGDFRYPGVYISVHHYRDWINDIIALNAS